MSGLTTEMIQAAVYDEYGSMFIDVAKEFDTWMKETAARDYLDKEDWD